MSLGKSISSGCKKYVASVPPLRQLNSGGTVDPQKMQAKVLSQWKVPTQLKDYLSKLTIGSIDNKTFENVFNKEFAHFLQRIQPSVYGKELVKYFESVTLPSTSAAKPEEKSTATTTTKSETDEGLIPNVLNGLKVKLGVSEDSKIISSNNKKVVPRWKEAQVVVTTESVASRTRHILFLLSEVNGDEMTLTRIEDLNAHVNKYPEAKHTAVKEGAIRLLLKKRKNTTNEEIKGAVNETLAVLGHVTPVPGRGVRILSVDGGGVRGILVIEMLKKLEEFTGKPVHQMFDLICGVSTGAIIASLIGVKQLSLDEISEIYKDLSIQIFTQSALKGTSNLVWSHSYYDTALWEKMLKNQIGEKTLISTARNEKGPKLCALSAVVNQSRLSAYIFRNYSLPCRVQSQYMGNHTHLVWEAVRASAAAPTYFEEFKLGNHLHQDGGILFNNPTAVAIHEAKLLWPETPLQCVISFGTGRTVPTPAELADAQSINYYSSWKEKFYSIIESATDTEGVHTMLSDLLPPDVYYRFNPYLTEMLDIAEIDPKKLEQLERDAVMYLRRNEDKFQEAATVLNYRKGYARRMLDFVNLQGQTRGLRIPTYLF